MKVEKGMIFNVPDMSCGHCQQAIETALGKLDAAAHVSVYLEQRQVEVMSSAAEANAIVAILGAIGFEASLVK